VSYRETRLFLLRKLVKVLFKLLLVPYCHRAEQCALVEEIKVHVRFLVNFLFHLLLFNVSLFLLKNTLLDYVTLFL